MINAKVATISRVMKSYNIDIEELPDNLKCEKCKLVLKDACQVPCGCRFCRICIDCMMVTGREICPGISEMCRESLLSHFTIDYAANNSVSKLGVKCVNDGCVYKCQLANLEEHLNECPKRSVECPFHELGCTEDKLAAEEIYGHLQQKNRVHSEMLIGIIANINREVEDNRREIDLLKQREEANKMEIAMLKQRDEGRSKEIEILNQRDVDREREVEKIKWELVLKDEQIKSIMDQIIQAEIANKSMKNEMKSIKTENEDLAERMKFFSENVDRDIESRKNTDELDIGDVTVHFRYKTAPVTELIGSNQKELTTEMNGVKDDMQSIKKLVQLIEEDVSSMKSQVQSLQTIVGLDDANFEWVIDEDVVKGHWVGRDKMSEHFLGVAHPYKYQMRSFNGSSLIGESLWIWVRIYQGLNDGKLAWPFEGRIVITVADKTKRAVSRTVSQQCRIERPPDNGYRRSNDFKFRHSELIGAGLDLSGGVRVSCVIVPGVGR